MMDERHDSPAPRRRLLRFSLRTFLTGALAIGIILGICGNYWKRLQRQRHIVSKVQLAGGEVFYDYQFAAQLDLDSWRNTVLKGSVIRRRDDGFLERTRETSAGEVREVETPAGPKFVRRW